MPFPSTLTPVAFLALFFASRSLATDGKSSGPSPRADTVWQPAVGASWQIVLAQGLSEADTSLDVDVFDIDLFENDASMISSLHERGQKVICYFSAGSYEDYRPDQDKFKESDIGSPLDGWEGEWWLDLRSETVRDIMISRLDMASDKGCDGVDPDNVDGYDNENGLDLTTNDTIEFVNWLADEAHARGMSIGLKNAGHIIPDVIENMEWSVNEQCVEYSECEVFAAFIDQGKPVFHLEYPKGEDVNDNNPVAEGTANRICEDPDAAGFSTLMKNMNLDAWLQACENSKASMHGLKSNLWMAGPAVITLALSYIM